MERKTVCGFVRYGADVNAPTEEGASPLHVAAAGGHAPIVHELLSANGSVNLKTMRGWTALHAAAQAGNPRVVRELMQFSADVEARTTGHGATPLHVSAMNGRCEVVEVLISKSFCTTFDTHALLCSKK